MNGKAGNVLGGAEEGAGPQGRSHRNHMRGC